VVRAGLRARFKAVAKRTVHIERLLPSSARRSPSQAVALEENATVQIYNDPGTATVDNQPTGAVDYILSKTDATIPALKVSDTVEGIADTLPITDPLNPALDFLPVAGKPPLPWDSSENFQLFVDEKMIVVESQIQLYCPNNLLAHPLISPALGYLGGLPPLLVIASDKEVLRDEIVYLFVSLLLLHHSYSIIESGTSVARIRRHIQTNSL
jgi:acetyl esterase/lipase